MSTTCSIYEPSQANLDTCAELLRQGEVVGVPTETVYGLAGNALATDCVRKIFSVKGRPLIDPLIVHFPTVEAAAVHIELNDAVKKLADKFWPGPLTLVVRKQATIPDIVTAGLPSVAIRVPRHPVLRQLLERLDFPLAAPSANPFGYVSPTLAEHVQHTLGERIPAVLDGGPCTFGLESTIVDLRDPTQPAILRYGPITQEQLSEALGIEVQDRSVGKGDATAQTAPGQLTQHYSPKAKVRLIEHGSAEASVDTLTSTPDTALLCNAKPLRSEIPEHIYWLSETGELNEVAHNLFELIQRLDQQGYSQLQIELSPETGIGKAINDRLRRAAAKA
jgi:L-threonylcarbamoyladenylate synthase